MEIVGAGPGHGADNSAGGSPVFSGIIRRQHGKFSNRIYSQIAAQNAARRPVAGIIDAYAVKALDFVAAGHPRCLVDPHTPG